MVVNFTQGSSQSNNPSSGGVYNQFVAPINSYENRSKRDSVRSVLIFLLVITVLVTGGMFYYTKVLASQIQNTKDQLKGYDSSPSIKLFETNLPEMRTLSQKLKLLNSVYDSKQYLSGMFFPILESVVESSRTSYVYFNKFNMKKDSTQNIANITLSGVALDYPTLYRQVNNFKFGPYAEYISNFKLNGFALDSDSHVTFDLAFNISINTPAYLKYELQKLQEANTSSGGVESGLLLNKNRSSTTTDAQNNSKATTTQAVIDFNTTQTASSSIQTGKTNQ